MGKNGYHLAQKTGSRKKGKNAVAASAYRGARRMKCERTGRVKNYSRKQDHSLTLMIVPDCTPAELRSPAGLWNAVELSEKRKDSQLYYDLDAALPNVLPFSAQKEIAIKFVENHLKPLGIAAEVNFHNCTPFELKGGKTIHERKLAAAGKLKLKTNPHVHIQYTTREITEDGFGAKIFGNTKTAGKNGKTIKAAKRNIAEAPDFLRELRKAWADYCNEQIELHAPAATRFDHRSHKDRGIAEEPSKHHGNRPGVMAQTGKTDELRQDAASAKRDLEELADKMIEERLDVIEALSDNTADNEALFPQTPPRMDLIVDAMQTSIDEMTEAFGDELDFRERFQRLALERYMGDRERLQTETTKAVVRNQRAMERFDTLVQAAEETRQAIADLVVEIEQAAKKVATAVIHSGDRMLRALRDGIERTVVHSGDKMLRKLRKGIGLTPD